METYLSLLCSFTFAILLRSSFRVFWSYNNIYSRFFGLSKLACIFVDYNSCNKIINQVDYELAWFLGKCMVKSFEVLLEHAESCSPWAIRVKSFKCFSSFHNFAGWPCLMLEITFSMVNIQICCVYIDWFAGSTGFVKNGVSSLWASLCVLEW